MVNNVDVQRFLMLFKGKNNTYVKNELPKEIPSETGKKISTRVFNVQGKVNAELITHHLNGDFGVGICPVTSDGKCFYGVIDIDYYGSKINKVFSFIRDYQLPLLPFRSKSGGLHLYLILAKAVSAKTMRETLAKINYFFSFSLLYGKNKVEIFPKQDVAEGFGSSITLPYFNCEHPYTYLYDCSGDKIDFNDALLYIQKHLTTISDVKECLTNLPYNDAPPCLQRLLLCKEVGDEDTGRNNFLFSFAIYAKDKYGDDFETEVAKVNSEFAVPLSDTVVKDTCASVRKKKEYRYKCKDIPCNLLCDTTECKKREFGLGRDKGYFTDIDYGQLYRYQAEEPYYVWQLRLQGQTEWKKVIFKDEGYLLDQKNFAKICIRNLDRAPLQVKEYVWRNILNGALHNIINVAVKKETDTSNLSVIRNSFVKYLANKQARRDSPYQIRVGLCVRQKVNGVYKYFFTHTGFEEFLRYHKINFDMTLMRETLKQFGAKEDVLTYTNALGEVRNFPCWSKEADKEIEDLYAGSIEVEEGDKANMGISVSEVTNTEDTNIEQKPYTQEDLKNAENMF